MEQQEVPGRAASPRAVNSGSLPGKTLTPEKINKIIEEGQILDDEYRVSSQIVGDEVLISTWANERTKSKEQDCKIDAVLIARKVMDVDPQAVKRVRVRYFDRKDKAHATYDEVVVLSGLVRSFAAGILGQDEILSSLTLTSHGDSSSGETSAGVVPCQIQAACPGPMQAERRDLLARIENLKKNHVGVGMFMKLFAQIEQDASAGRESAVSEGLKALYAPVAEQENTTRQARLGPVRINVISVRGSSALEGAQGMSKEKLTEKQREIVANARKAIEDSKRQYGDFYPELGPMYADRYRIARLLVDWKDQGKKVDQFLPMFKEMEQYAAMSNLNMLTQSIHMANLKLGLKDLVADDQYKRDQAEMDMLKQNLQRKL